MIKEKKLWKIKKNQNEIVQAVARENNISVLMAQILVSRGYTHTEDIKRFLNPKISHLYSPFLMKDMKKAVGRISNEINNGGKILIYGDYDVDGVASTAVLYNFLKSAGANVDYYIPDRFEEGYGLNMDTAAVLCVQGPALIITVDNGISACEEIDYINSQGIDVIITDHHECQEVLPKAFAVVNPKQHECKYPFKFLAGVGVAFKVVQALCEDLLGDGDKALEYLDLVCVGTVADIVPLIDENRVIVKYGLEALSDTANPGLKALCEVSGVNELNTWAVGFALAPRINAAGRLGEASRAVELFTVKDMKRAGQLAEELDRENKNRQDIESDLLEEVIKKIELEGLNNDNIMVIHGENWHHGVMGIVASRVVERYQKPCMIISFEKDEGRGSGRSIEGFNLFEALSRCSRLLEKYGGHELAGGLTISRNKMAEFKNEIIKVSQSMTGNTGICGKIDIDSSITVESLDIKVVSELKRMEPFGMANPQPLFCVEGLEIENLKAVGDNKHLKMCLSKEKCKVNAIAFRMGEMQSVLKYGDCIDVVCTPEVNRYMGRVSLQLNIKDIRSSKKQELEYMYYKTLFD